MPASERVRENAVTASDVAVVELRQYTLRSGGRDVLVDIFERHLIAPQEEVGARILGHFRDLDDPDRFVWLRGFRDMARRRAALEAFYGGDSWMRHRDAANATLVDHENVLLLRPAPGTGLPNGTRPSGERPGGAGSLVTATIWPFAEPISADVAALLTDEIAPLLAEAGAPPVALLVTEPSENDYPRLAIREGENVLVWLARFDDPAALEAHATALDRSPRWRELVRAIDGRLAGRPETLRLAPAARSALA